MIQPPSPPQKASQYLEELAEYYRELIEYYQTSAIAASQQLGHVEALLGNDPRLPTQQVGSWLVDESAEQNTIASDSSNDGQSSSVGSFWLEGMDSSEELEVVENEDNNPSENLEEFTLPSIEQLQEFFREERGNMVQIDYILHHFFDISAETPQEPIKDKLKKQLKIGSQQQMWSQVPDAPDCWTFTLSDFAEFAPSHQDNPLFPDLKSEVLPTKKVAELLSIQTDKIYEIRSLYSDDFIKGTDYFQNNKGHYLWSKKGVEKISDFNNKLGSKKTKNSLTPKDNSSNLKSSPPQMLPSYHGLATEKAIKKLFQDNPGREWTISQVVTGIYGNLTKKQESFVRDKITKGLSKGHLDGLWRRVPRKVGVYSSQN